MKILVCTVGGSDAPLVTAVRDGAWDHVMFVCTSESLAMVTDRVVDRPSAARQAAERPAIPVQAGLAPFAWSSVSVPADDPDRVYATLIERLDALRAQYADASITVDFTGGTKSMSAGAVLAVASRAGTALQVTTGQRSDLIRVVDGTQQAVALGTDRIVLDRQIDLLRELWRNFGYREAADGFERLWREKKELPDRDDQLVARLRFYCEISSGFAAWDMFDHTGARNRLNAQRRSLSPALEDWIKRADAMLAPASKAAQAQAAAAPGQISVLTLFDLLRNAERCFARGRYDDAVARCYRLWEWSVQWLLFRHSGIDTGAVPADTVKPETVARLQVSDGAVKLGLMDAWSHCRRLQPGSPVDVFWREQQGQRPSTDYSTAMLPLSNFATSRNRSILAHGQVPIGRQKCEEILAWTAGPFMSMVRGEARRLGEPDDVPQLPTGLPEPLATDHPR